MRPQKKSDNGNDDDDEKKTPSTTASGLVLSLFGHNEIRLQSVCMLLLALTLSAMAFTH